MEEKNLSGVFASPACNMLVPRVIVTVHFQGSSNYKCITGSLCGNEGSEGECLGIQSQNCRGILIEGRGRERTGDCCDTDGRNGMLALACSERDSTR